MPSTSFTPHNRIKTEPSRFAPSRHLSIPFPDISVCAGFPSPAADFTESSVDLNQLLIKHPAATFFIRVEGSSMVGAGIFPGDLLVVDRSLEPRHNTVIIAILNGEFTVKRLQKNNATVTLAPENPRYQSIRVTPESDFEVWGVVTHVIHEPDRTSE
jgi:DNA polymerase V